LTIAKQYLNLKTGGFSKSVMPAATTTPAAAVATTNKQTYHFEAPIANCCLSLQFLPLSFNHKK